MMEDVYDQFLKLSEEMRPEVDTILQSQNMSETEREKFLEMFAQDRGKSRVGFFVMGGICSELIDLAEDRLIGAIIVGTGLPQVCNEREIVKQYFEKQDMRGFDYAYLYPGMNKVLQSAGRVIRTEKDKGLILLLDDRFCQRQYREIFPREWDGYRICSAETLEDYMASFWK